MADVLTDKIVKLISKSFFVWVHVAHVSIMDLLHETYLD